MYTMRHEMQRLRTTWTLWVLLPLATVVAALAAASEATSINRLDRVGTMVALLVGGDRTFFVIGPAVCAGIAGVVFCGDQYHAPSGAMAFVLMPRRGRLLAVSTALVAAYSLLLALVGVASAWLAWTIAGPEAAGDPSGPRLAGAMIWYAAAVLGAGLLGVGCATLLRRAPALAVTLTLVILGEPMLTRAVAGVPQPYGLPHVGWLNTLGTVLGTIGRWMIPTSEMTPSGLSTALVDLTALVAAVLALGIRAARRRDI